MRITDYHRQIAARYYGKLVNKYGLTATLRHIPQIKNIIWTAKGQAMIERRVQP